jgi:hypothetical protein
VGSVASANLRVQRIHATGMHTYQRLVSAQSRTRHPGQDEWTVYTLDDEGLHFSVSGHALTIRLRSPEVGPFGCKTSGKP